MKSSQVYNALRIAAERMGANNYASQMADHLAKGRKRHTLQFVVTAEHRAIVNAMGDRNIDDDSAMAMLHEYETAKQRLGV